MDDENTSTSFERLVLKLGPFKTVLVITLMSVILSLLVTSLGTYFVEANQQWSTPSLTLHDWLAILGLAAFVPMLIAPIVTWHLTQLVFRIDALKTQLKSQAKTDDLTSLNNRSAMMAGLNQFYRLAIRDQKPIVLIMMDVDHFKTINDQFGHGAGDLVLEVLGRLLKTLVRRADIVGRIGGEEFLLCMYAATYEDANTFIERLQKALQNEQFVYNHHAFTVTLSFGVARMTPDQVIPIELLLQRSDQALYKAKQLGRNRSIAYQAEGDLFSH